MKAVRLLEYGGQLVFNDVPTPAIARDEILVKIKSTAVNHIDLVKASGTLRQILPIDLPWIPGHEFPGIHGRLAMTSRIMPQVTLKATALLRTQYCPVSRTHLQSHHNPTSKNATRGTSRRLSGEETLGMSPAQFSF